MLLLQPSLNFKPFRVGMNHGFKYTQPIAAYYLEFSVVVACLY